MSRPITDTVSARVEIGKPFEFDRVRVGLKLDADLQVANTFWPEREDARRREMIAEAIRVCHARLVRDVYEGVHELGRKLLEAVHEVSYHEALNKPFFGRFDEMRSIAIQLMGYGKETPKIDAREIRKSEPGREAPE